MQKSGNFSILVVVNRLEHFFTACFFNKCIYRISSDHWKSRVSNWTYESLHSYVIHHTRSAKWFKAHESRPKTQSILSWLCLIDFNIYLKKWWCHSMIIFAIYVSKFAPSERNAHFGFDEIEILPYFSFYISHWYRKVHSDEKCIGKVILYFLDYF